MFHWIAQGVEIALLTIILNYLLKLFWGTNAIDVVFGFIAFLLLFLISSWLSFPVLEKIMVGVLEVAVIAVFIIFQPELRLALSKLRVKGKKYRAIDEFELFLDNLSQVVYRLSERQIGALIVLENRDAFEGFVTSFVTLQAQFSPELLESLFMPSSPLHDGAIVIRGGTIVAANTILPLAQESPELTKTMGTRHRAALGASQKSDALIIVVSEQSGKVSIAREGILTRGIKIDRFRGIVRSVLANPEKKESFSLQRMWKR